jgi:LacI family transcriptional regulator
MPETPVIAIALETSRAYGRGLVRGIVRYKRLHGPWTLVASPGHLEKRSPVLRNQGLSGLIAQVSSPQLGRMIRSLNLPTIVIEPELARLVGVSHKVSLAEIRSDSEAIARMVATHLLERGFKRFAYCGLPDRLWSGVRQKVFAESVAEAGYSCEIYPFPRGEQYHTWQRELPLVAQWLSGLQKPIGLMVANDDRGLQVLRACRAARVQVPEEVAVVGVDDDELVCEVCDPPLSSVSVDVENAGYAAASLLDAMMGGHATERHEIVVKPLWVTSRRSSDAMAQDDPLIAQVLRFIRDNAGRPIGVQDVVENSGLARRTLEKQFVDATHTSIGHEIMRCRVERAKPLLIETTLPMARVAAAAGFPATKPMARAFREFEHCLPWEYRKAHGAKATTSLSSSLSSRPGKRTRRL